MSILDLDKLAAPVAADKPTGDDLEYDAEFMELGRIAEGKPEQRIGDHVNPAEPPNWSDVQSRSETLLSRTKDLRVAVHLARSAVARHGFAGLADGLALVARLLEQYWDSVHPRLDPDDDNDPTLRVNCLLPLSDRIGFVGTIRATPIVKSPLLGQFSFREYLIANGTIPQEEGDTTTVPTSAQIDGAFREVDIDVLTETSAALESSVASVATIIKTITDQVGASFAPDLEWLKETLRDIRKLLAEQLALRGVGTGPEAEPGEAGAPRRGAPGEIASRNDVVSALERVCEYYARHEPSSPVPILLRRAQRLAHMDFMEILRDMTPAGVSEAELIGGIRPPPA